MKQIILSLFALCSLYTAQAASCVTVQQVSTDYAAGRVTFDLKWGTCNNTSHLYRAWVFVDYRPVTGTTKGTWQRAALNTTDKGTLVSAGNGVWITGTANATQRVTLTLNVSSTKFDWCAYAFDYPPNAVMANGTYTLKGNPPFILNGSTTLAATQTTYTGGCITSITDKTNNPEGRVTNLAFVAGSIPSTGQTICAGSAYTAITGSANASGGDSRITYRWLRNGTAIAGTNSANYTPTQAGTYTRQAHDGTCNTGWANSSGSWVVTVVNIPPVPTLTATTVCSGTAVTFTASASGATGYQWQGAGVAAGSGTAATKASKATTAGNYVAQVRSYVTAAGITCYSAYSANKTGVIVATPAVPTVTNNGNKCAGTAITFSAGGGGSNVTGYAWAGSVSGNGTTRNTATTAGAYSAYARAYYTLSGITCYSGYSGTSTARIYAFPSTGISGASAVDKGKTITLSGSPSGGTWSSNNTGIATVSSTGVVTGVATGDITITYTVTANSCSSSTAKAIEVNGGGDGDGVDISGCENIDLSFTSGFVSSQTWVVGAQTWSAPVTATYCNKIGFDGGSSGTYKSDCLSNSIISSGDLFSYCMVAKFKETICPSGWRVPTTDDFCTLDKALNGRSDCSNRNDATSSNRYLSTWGGQYGGHAYSGSLYYQGERAHYWSQSEVNADRGRFLYLLSNGNVGPQVNNDKEYGFTLRCVK